MVAFVVERRRRRIAAVRPARPYATRHDALLSDLDRAIDQLVQLRGAAAGIRSAEHFNALEEEMQAIRTLLHTAFRGRRDRP